MKRTLIFILPFTMIFKAYSQDIPKDAIAYKLVPDKKEWMAKRVIAVGEQLHGIKEFNQARFELIDSLLESTSPDLLCMEAGLEATIAFDLAQTDEQIAASLQYFYPVYQTKEYLDFFKALKKNHPNTTLAGFELQDPITMTALLRYNIPCFDSSFLEADKFLYKLASLYDKEYEKKVFSFELNPDDLALLKDRYQDIKTCAISALPNTDLPPTIIKLLLLSIENRLTQVELLDKRQNVQFKRDSLMADRIFRIDSIFKSKQFIVTAANGHITKCNYGSFFFEKPMGAYLDERYLNSYYTIGIIGLKGYGPKSFSKKGLEVTIHRDYVNTRDEKKLYQFITDSNKPSLGLYSAQLKSSIQFERYNEPLSKCFDYIYMYKNFTSAAFIK